LHLQAHNTLLTKINIHCLLITNEQANFFEGALQPEMQFAFEKTQHEPRIPAFS